jgi:predicted nucleotidyltransferase
MDISEVRDKTATLGISPERHELLMETIAHLNVQHGDDLLGVVLTESAARGLDHERSDLDVVAVFEETDPVRTPGVHQVDLKVIPNTLAHLETPYRFGSTWGWRWTFAWAPVLLDRTGGRIQAAIDRHTWLTADEQIEILVGHSLLDAWINQIYRALKSARNGNVLAARLDAAESNPYLLDVVHALNGLVRPYSSYLEWALDHHPLPGWPKDEVIRLLERTLEGDATSIRGSYRRICEACQQFDTLRGEPLLQTVIDTWNGESYDILRG